MLYNTVIGYSSYGNGFNFFIHTVYYSSNVNSVLIASVCNVMESYLPYFKRAERAIYDTPYNLVMKLTEIIDLVSKISVTLMFPFLWALLAILKYILRILQSFYPRKFELYYHEMRVKSETQNINDKITYVLFKIIQV